MRDRAALAIIAVIMATASLEADVALGAAEVMFGFGMGLSPAVILIESVVAFRIFRGAGVAAPVVAVIIANLASAILGLVIASYLPFRFSGRRPDQGIRWLMAFCVPFFALSVVLEYEIARRLVGRHFASRAWRWAIQANVESYLMIEAVLLIFLLV